MAMNYRPQTATPPYPGAKNWNTAPGWLNDEIQAQRGGAAPADPYAAAMWQRMNQPARPASGVPGMTPQASPVTQQAARWAASTPGFTPTPAMYQTQGMSAADAQASAHARSLQNQVAAERGALTPYQFTAGALVPPPANVMTSPDLGYGPQGNEHLHQAYMDAMQAQYQRHLLMLQRAHASANLQAGQAPAVTPLDQLKNNQTAATPAMARVMQRYGLTPQQVADVWVGDLPIYTELAQARLQDAKWGVPMHLGPYRPAPGGYSSPGQRALSQPQQAQAAPPAAPPPGMAAPAQANPRQLLYGTASTPGSPGMASPLARPVAGSPTAPMQAAMQPQGPNPNILANRQEAQPGFDKYAPGKYVRAKVIPGMEKAHDAFLARTAARERTSTLDPDERRLPLLMQRMGPDNALKFLAARQLEEGGGAGGYGDLLMGRALGISPQLQAARMNAGAQRDVAGMGLAGKKYKAEKELEGRQAEADAHRDAANAPWGPQAQALMQSVKALEGYVEGLKSGAINPQTMTSPLVQSLLGLVFGRPAAPAPATGGGARTASTPRVPGVTNPAATNPAQTPPATPTAPSAEQTWLWNIIKDAASPASALDAIPEDRAKGYEAYIQEELKRKFPGQDIPRAIANSGSPFLTRNARLVKAGYPALPVPAVTNKPLGISHPAWPIGG